MSGSKKKKADWAAIEIDYRSGVGSVMAIASAQGVSEGAIRLRAKKQGWTRDPSGRKREIVNAAMSGVSQKTTNETTNETTNSVIRRIDDAAAEDIVDMGRGIYISRRALVKLEAAIEKVSEPKEIKVIVEATGLAIDSIRRIRGLDTPPGKQSPEDDEMTHEELIEECKRLGLPTSIFD